MSDLPKPEVTFATVKLNYDVARQIVLAHGISTAEARIIGAKLAAAARNAMCPPQPSVCPNCKNKPCPHDGKFTEDACFGFIGLKAERGTSGSQVHAQDAGDN